MFILQTVGLLGRVISSSQVLYLNTGHHKHRIDTHIKYPCLCENRTHDPGFRASEDSACLDHAATVTVQANLGCSKWNAFNSRVFLPPDWILSRQRLRCSFRNLLHRQL
jgi:hypothetical protein